MDRLLARYAGFTRLKATTYFLAGGETEDLIQEGRVGLCKAVRDYCVEKRATFRSFAELCIERQMMTAIKAAARHKHGPLNTSVSFSYTRAGSHGEREVTLAEILPGDATLDPMRQAIAKEELGSLVECLCSELSELESAVLVMYLEGRSYEEIAERVARDTKAVDNALHRVKKKVARHLRSREVIDLP